MIVEPKVAYLANPEIVKYDIKFPSGKIITLTPNKTYKTEDADELDFLSKQKGIGLGKMNDKEFRMWATLQFDRIPTVYNDNIKDKKDVEEFVWSSEYENEIVQKLKDNGYIIYKKEVKGKK